MVAPDLPLRLGKDLVIDRLTGDEVTRCRQAGLFRPMLAQWHSSVIDDEQAVGFRWTTSLEKRVLRGDEPPQPPESADEGRFCDRPLPRLDLTLDDVLSALRLLKPGVVSAAGAASWADSPWVRGTSFHLRGDSRHFGEYELSKEEARDLQQLWGLLEKLEKGSPLSFSIHRFNQAFERGLRVDRIVDLVISAESLFLGDIQDRGELSFRLALRAAKFIVDPKYCEQEIYKRMKEAYDARSAIVHGRRTTDSKLPDINKLEDLVRLGLRKALSFDDPKRLKEPQYWESLILSGSNPP